jgi:hypothetical protein
LKAEKDLWSDDNGSDEKIDNDRDNRIADAPIDAVKEIEN